MIVPPIAPLLLLNTITNSRSINSSYDSGNDDYINRTSCVRADSIPHYGLHCYIELNTLCCNICNITNYIGEYCNV